MRAIVIACVLFTSSVIAQDHVVVGYARDLNTSKKDKLKTNVEELGIRFPDEADYDKVGTTNEWIVGCFWRSQFPGGIDDAKIAKALKDTPDTNEVCMVMSTDPKQDIDKHSLTNKKDKVDSKIK